MLMFNAKYGYLVVNMKFLIVFCFVSISAPLFAAGGVINTSADLNDWCKDISSAHFIEQGAKPYNWTNSRWNDEDVLFVQGSWKVDKVEQFVKCSAKKGASEDSAKWEQVDK